MKAYRLHGIGDLRLEDIPIPEPQPGWALIKVKACGICSSDIPRIYKNGTYHFPTIPGHEFSGEVVKVGSNCDSGLIGGRVGVFPLIPCRRCASCERGNYETCSNYDYIGSRRDGAFAEYVLAPVWNLMRLPDTISYAEAALLEPLAVAIHSLRGIDLQQKKVAVIGTGMIGFSVAKIAQSKGAEAITVIGRSEKKKAFADSLELDYIYQKTDSLFDVCVEAVGTSESLEKAILSTANGGVVIPLGNPYGDIVLQQKTYWQILRRQLTLIGTWNSSYEHGKKCDWTKALESIDSGLVDVKPLITHRFDFNDLPAALQLMRDHKEEYCKIIIENR